MQGVRVTGIDHVVFVVADVERSLAWWTGRLGAEGVRVEAWRRGEVPFCSVRLAPTCVVDLVAGQRTGENVAHVAVTVEADLDAVAGGGDLDVVDGPKPLFGARGQGRGLYVRDPDGNVVELRTYDGAAR